MELKEVVTISLNDYNELKNKISELQERIKKDLVYEKHGYFHGVNIYTSTNAYDKIIQDIKKANEQVSEMCCRDRDDYKVLNEIKKYNLISLVKWWLYNRKRG